MTGLQCVNVQCTAGTTAIGCSEGRNVRNGARKSTSLLHVLDIACWQPESLSIIFNISFILHGLKGWKVNFPDFLATRLMNVIEVLPVRWNCVIFWKAKRRQRPFPFLCQCFWGGGNPHFTPYSSALWAVAAIKSVAVLWRFLISGWRLWYNSFDTYWQPSDLPISSPSKHVTSI